MPDLTFNFPDKGLIEVEWIPGETNCSDMLTKNLVGPAFEKHMTRFVTDMEVE